MKFWKDNKISGEFDMPAATVAEQFTAAVKDSPDWQAKLDNWPLDRVLRDWLTSKDGLSASWEDDKSYQELYDLAYKQVRA